jgi:hypothetical protein
MFYMEPSRKDDLFADFCPTPGKDDRGKAIAVLLGCGGKYRHIPDSYMTTDMQNQSTPTWITPRNVEYPQGIAIVTTSLVVGKYQRPDKNTPLSVDTEERILAAVLEANRRTRGWVAHVMLGRDLDFATDASSLFYRRIAEHVGYPKTLVEGEQTL